MQVCEFRAETESDLTEHYERKHKKRQLKAEQQGKCLKKKAKFVNKPQDQMQS